MRRLYLCDILRSMRYYARSTWGKGEPDDYQLQVVLDYKLVYSERAPTDTDLIEGAKAAGVPIHGQHWADYFTPENALEKRMVDDVKTLSSVVSKLITVEALETLGYSKSAAKKILKDATYVIGEDA
jgi:hypothetical protein